MFDLTGEDDRIRFSPFCWRARTAMALKGLNCEYVPWRFTETARLEQSGQGRVPVLVDTERDRVVHDSWAIAVYLDETYPDQPVMRDDAARASAKLVETWTNHVLFPPLRPLAVEPVHRLLGETDGAYFKESREAALKAPLAEVSSPDAQGKATADLARVLKTLEPTLSEHDFLGGTAPYYGDCIVFGTLMWPYIVNPGFALEGAPATGRWFERMLDVGDGGGRKALRAPA
ncbi:MAG: glutathione S-transferase N-terminal domain-containing protein [Pseudomonadota bacterium]